MSPGSTNCSAPVTRKRPSPCGRRSWRLVEHRTSRPARRPRRFALVISAVAAAALIIALVVVNTGSPGAVEIVPAVDTIPEGTAPRASAPDVLTTEASDEPTVTYRDGVSWWVPTWVPDDLSFSYAVQESDTPGTSHTATAHRRAIGRSTCRSSAERYASTRSVHHRGRSGRQRLEALRRGSQLGGDAAEW